MRVVPGDPVLSHRKPRQFRLGRSGANKLVDKLQLRERIRLGGVASALVGTAEGGRTARRGNPGRQDDTTTTKSTYLVGSRLVDGTS